MQYRLMPVLVALAACGEAGVEFTDGLYFDSEPGMLVECDGRYYDMNRLTERVQRIDVLRQGLGFDRVNTCDRAKLTTDAYLDLIESMQPAR